MNSALRGQYLAALGLESWTLRRGPATGLSQSAPGQSVAVPEQSVPVGEPGAPLREPIAPAAEACAPAAARVADLGWVELRAAVAACTRCPLSATRTQTVFGVGSLEAKWLIVGEAPGAEEDQTAPTQPEPQTPPPEDTKPPTRKPAAILGSSRPNSAFSTRKI